MGQHFTCYMDEYVQLQKKVRQFLAKEPFSIRGLSDEQLTIFCRAFIHDSYSNEAMDQGYKHRDSYERLEFLGDSIVEFIACESIFHNSDYQEGRMTDFKQEVVANKKISQSLADAGIDMDNVMLLGHGHRDPKTKENIVEDCMRADVFEALVAAVYITYGMDRARKLVTDVLILPAMSRFEPK